MRVIGCAHLHHGPLVAYEGVEAEPAQLHAELKGHHDQGQQLQRGVDLQRHSSISTSTQGTELGEHCTTGSVCLSVYGLPVCVCVCVWCVYGLPECVSVCVVCVWSARVCVRVRT